MVCTGDGEETEPDYRFAIETLQSHFRERRSIGFAQEVQIPPTKSVDCFRSCLDTQVAKGCFAPASEVE
jgi:hypothetical protein